MAVRVSLINGVTSGLMNISRAFAKVNGDAVMMKRRLDAIKFTAIAGAAMLGTGLFGLGLLSKTLPYAKEYTRQLALMNTLGMKQADIARVVGQAWKTTNAVPTSTAAQNLESFRELRSAFGSDSAGQSHAAMMLPVVARLSGVMQSLTGREQHHVGFDMVKAIELRTGVMTEAALIRNSELMSKAIIGMGGTVSAADFHGTMKMGKMATNKWSDDFAYNYLPTLMQELKTGAGGGAQSAGTILMSLYQQMHGKMTKAAMPLWVQGGLVAQSDIVKTSTGQYQMKPGSVAGTGLFEQNPYLWVQQYLRPAVARIQAQHAGMSAETAINAMFSNRNAAFGAYNMLFKSAQYDRDKVTIGKADGGYTAYQKLLKTDPTLAAAALHAQWQNLLAVIGYQVLPTLVHGTLLLVRGLQGLTSAMRAHPALTKTLVIGFAALSAVMAFGGTVLLLGAAFGALELALDVLAVPALLPMIAGAVMSLGAALGTVALPVVLVVGAVAAVGFAIWEMVKHWNTSKGVIWNIKNEFHLLVKFFADKVSWLVSLIPGMGGGPKTTVNAPNAAGNWTDNRGGPHAVAGGPSNWTDNGAHSRFVAPARGPAKTTIEVPVYLDKRKIGQAMTDYFGEGFSGRSAMGRFDPNAALPAAGAPYR